jgi:uncharacterized protein YjbI with pentapeptide repeats
VVAGKPVALQASLSGTNLTGASLVGVGKPDLDLSGTNMTGADLRYANLPNAVLKKTNLTKSDLRDANLSSADLQYTNLSGANLAAADLTEADLSYAYLEGTSFQSINQEKINIGSQTSLAEASTIRNRVGFSNGSFLVNDQGTFSWRSFNLTDELKAGEAAGINNGLVFVCAADLSGAILRGQLPSLNFAGVDLRQADLRGADLRLVNFEERLQVAGQNVVLRANLNNVLYDNQTRWPAGFQPPASGASTDNSP